MRKLLVIIPAAIILILAFALVMRFRSLGSLSVTTNFPDAEIYTYIKEKKQLLGTGNITKKLSPGNYDIYAEVSNQTSRGNVLIQSGGTAQITLDIREKGKISQIATYSVTNLKIEDQIKFLNTPQRLVYQYNPKNEVAQIVQESLYPVTGLVWGGSTAYVVVNTSSLHALTGSSARPMDVPGTGVISALTANERGDVAAARGGKIFRKLGSEPALRQIDTYDSSDPTTEIVLRLSSNGTLLVSTYVPIDNGIAAGAKAHFINPDDSKKPFAGEYSVLEAQWSPDSKHLAVYSDKQLFDYNATSGESLAFSQATSTSAFNWVTSERLMFVDGTSIWVYEPRQAIAYKVVDLPGLVAERAPFALGASGEVYFSTAPKDDLGTGAAIYKLLY